MRTDRPIPILILCTLLSILPGCATTSAPKEWLPQPTQTQSETFGGWIDLYATTEDQTQHLYGELIAVHTDSIFVLQGPDVIALPKTNITRAKLTTFRSGHGRVIIWTFLGLASTLSHGYYAVLTIPAWILSGMVSTIIQSRTPQITKSRKTSWDKFVKYARFPQGLPPNLNRHALSPEGITVVKGKDIGPDTFKKDSYLWITYFSKPNQREIKRGRLYRTDATTLAIQIGNLSQKTIAYSDIISVWTQQ